MPDSLDKAVEKAARERLRQSDSPFTFLVATSASEADCRRYNVPEFLESQRKDIKSIIDLFRQEPRRASQVFPILGDTGSGKTHLLTTLRQELDGGQQLFIVADSFPSKPEPLDFFLWQIANHLLAHSGPGARMIRALSQRLTSRLLAEALRRLEPGQRLRLFAPRGLQDKIGRWFGWSSAVEPLLSRAESVITACDAAGVGDVAGTCLEAGIAPDRACGAIQVHVENTEGSSADGYFRRGLFMALTRFALLDDHDALEDFLTADLNAMPAHVAANGPPAKRLLTALLELFSALHIPVVLVFDQLEDIVGSGNMEQESERKKNFCRGLAALVNGIPGLCVLLFAERGLRNEILGSLERYELDRLTQPFSLPGQSACQSIDIPDRLIHSMVAHLIRARVWPALEDFEGKEKLPESFPFTDADLEEVSREGTIRNCLQQLSRHFGERITNGEDPAPVETTDIRKTLNQRWNYRRKCAGDEIAQESLSAKHIPRLAEALDKWLNFLLDNYLTGPMTWAKVDLRQGEHPGFSWLNLIRTNGPKAGGLGIGFWLAELKHKPNDLSAKLDFFKTHALMRTLVLLRRDGAAPLVGVSQERFDAAIQQGRDVRLEEVTDAELASVLAFPAWLETVQAEFDLSKDDVRVAARNFVGEKSAPLLDRIQRWQSAPAGAEVTP